VVVVTVMSLRGEGGWRLPDQHRTWPAIRLPNPSIADGTWAVDLPAEEVPPEVPEPASGCNFARESWEQMVLGGCLVA
jgi:hypothetical protein